jgi:UDP-3-O-[3-hydroxymyristoyl] glucosamine N-acyltransferase
MRVRELAEWLGAPLEGQAGLEITGLASIESAGPADLSFAAGKRAAEVAASSQAGCLLVDLSFVNHPARTLIRVSDPRTEFARVIRKMRPEPVPPVAIHPTAVISSGARIGNGVVIGPHCSIGAGVTIGDGGRLHANVTIYDGVEIGARCVLHSGCVIGADGFGFALNAGRWEKFPQIGRVVIGNDVEIGANSCVDRAALGVTSIGDGTKLDNMVHIAHNCSIGKHVVIAAQTGFAGGCVVEDYAVIGGQVGFGEKVRVRSRAVLGSGAGVLSSKIIPAGQVMWGTPARPLKQYLEQLANLSRLPELRKQLRELAARVEKLGG